jgi:hypothetical protein
MADWLGKRTGCFSWGGRASLRVTRRWLGSCLPERPPSGLAFAAEGMDVPGYGGKL